MNRTRLDGFPRIFVGIGLVLVGLLAGIFVMLFLMNQRDPQLGPPKVVERVELGPGSAYAGVGQAESIPAGPMPDARTLNRLFKAVAEKVTPAVVYIQVTMGGDDGDKNWFHRFDKRFREPAPRQSVGSGVIVSPQGYIVTNNHVVENATTISVTLSDKRQYDATIVGVDPNTDLAVIKIKTDALVTAIAIGDSDTIDVGEWVLAIGNPFRLTSTVTAGIVSALGRQVNIIEDNFGIEDFIQTDAAINPGNSGGALVNLSGELVGISTAIATETGSYEGYGFAVPVDLVERVARDLIAYGEVKRGYLGVSIGQVDARLAKKLGMAHIHGVYLNEVLHGGAAYKAGLRKEDVVLAIDHRPVDAPNTLQSYVARHRPGDRLDVEVLREGRRHRFQILLLGRESPVYESWISELNRRSDVAPQPPPSESDEEILDLDRWGMGLQAIGDRARMAFDVADGVYVAYVTHGSVAARSGLPRDVVILRIGGESVLTLDAARQALATAAEQGDPVLLRVKRRDGIEAFFEVDVPENE